MPLVPKGPGRTGHGSTSADFGAATYDSGRAGLSVQHVAPDVMAYPVVAESGPSFTDRQRAGPQSGEPQRRPRCVRDATSAALACATSPCSSATSFEFRAVEGVEHVEYVDLELSLVFEAERDGILEHAGVEDRDDALRIIGLLLCAHAGRPYRRGPGSATAPQPAGSEATPRGMLTLPIGPGPRLHVTVRVEIPRRLASVELAAADGPRVDQKPRIAVFQPGLRVVALANAA